MTVVTHKISIQNASVNAKHVLKCHAHVTARTLAHAQSFAAQALHAAAGAAAGKSVFGSFT